MDKGSAEWFETGIRLVITDKMLANLNVEADRDAAFRAVIYQIRSSMLRYMTGVHDIDRIEVPDGLWQHIKMKLPFLKPRMRTHVVVMNSYNLCPHLRRDDESIHREFVQFDPKEWERGA